MQKILMAAALIVSASAFAQSTPEKINFTKGQKLEIVTQTEKSSTMEVMGQSMQTTVNSTLTQQYKVEDIVDGGTVIEHDIKRLQFNLSSAMGGDQKFDSDKESDRKSDIGKMLEKGLKNKYKMTIDVSGKVAEVKPDDTNPNAKSDPQSDAMAAMMASQMGFNAGLPKVGSLSPFKPLPARKLKVGESWKENSSDGGITTVTNYTVKSITEKDVVLDFTEETTTKTTQNIMGQDATISSNDKSSGTVTVDITTGLLKERKAAVETKGSVEAQGMTIPVQGKTSITVTVNTL